MWGMAAQQDLRVGWSHSAGGDLLSVTLQVSARAGEVAAEIAAVLADRVTRGLASFQPSLISIGEPEEITDWSE
jgi:hypothetical protein